jgi:hypothetical protein
MDAAKGFDPYELIGIITPGTVVALLLMTESSEFRAMLGVEGVSIGGLGLFVLMAFVLGHLVQSIGNMLEFVIWPAGLPTNKVRFRSQNLVSTAQQTSLEARISEMEGENLQLATLNRRSWRSITARAYARVHSAGRSQRIDIFNRTYGLCRGLVAAIAIALAWYFFAHPDRVYVLVILTLMLLSAVWRMRRAGHHYARALMIEFIDLPKA